MSNQSILWHGSPRRFEAFSERSPLTRLHAFWTTDDPLIAALYAGPDGWVLPVVVAPDATLLDASGWPGVRPLHEISPDECDALSGHLDTLGIGLDDEQLFGDASRTLRFTLRQGYGGSGDISKRVCWEAVIQEDENDNEDLNALLRASGFGAVLCVDPLPGVIGDIERRLAGGIRDRFNEGRAEIVGMSTTDWLALESRRQHAHALRITLAALKEIRLRGEPPIAVAFLEPDAAIVLQNRAVRALDILKSPAGSLLRRRSPLRDYQDACHLCQLKPEEDLTMSASF